LPSALAPEEQKTFKKRDQKPTKLKEDIKPLLKKWKEEKVNIKDFKNYDLPKELLNIQVALQKLTKANKELVYRPTRKLPI
jgi:hypothetical protein